eukprot:CAMPEP_0174707034 /NCGR_PEP_ID=MMETSP1094-20130205/9671_1 /TAXON_ID=156173 /ORGANISM="Chrysochromulina brevifilum, Strain UTEX LB 985" /LENGTH=120 /DNA_ID=CAMNT_0015905369 /DNA_START=253 /DNA_END=611 /DNA_ORIENTATION=+
MRTAEMRSGEMVSKAKGREGRNDVTVPHQSALQRRQARVGALCETACDHTMQIYCHPPARMLSCWVRAAEEAQESQQPRLFLLEVRRGGAPLCLVASMSRPGHGRRHPWSPWPPSSSPPP